MEEIEIYNCPALSDLSFIYELPNLKRIVIKESGYITQELIDYLDSKEIEHNLTKQDVKNREELDRIISEIITDDMTEEEKIKAIVYYVMDNYEFDENEGANSNICPLSNIFNRACLGNGRNIIK